MKKKLLFVFGTRPEVIKMASTIKKFQEFPNDYDLTIAVTGQHREMLFQALDLFEIKPDYDLELMKHNQSLSFLTSASIEGITKLLNEIAPDLVFVQGDTTTTFTASLAAFYARVPVAHIEAGLRTKNIYSPFPEEINRRLTSVIAKFHFPPTETSKSNLISEGIEEEMICITGNTVIDALLMITNKSDQKQKYLRFFFDKYGIDFNNDRKKILVTGHRRESFGEGFLNICNALKDISEKHDVEIIYPVHLNPNVQEPVFSILKDRDNVYLIDPQQYDYFLYLMKRSYLILTDSGGIQEEAPSLNKPVLLMRDTTEREEAVKAGTSLLVGTDQAKIIETVERLLNDTEQHALMSNAKNPYGEGDSCERIFDFLIDKI